MFPKQLDINSFHGDHTVFLLGCCLCERHGKPSPIRYKTRFTTSGDAQPCRCSRTSTSSSTLTSAGLHPYAPVERPAAAMSALPERPHWPLGHVPVSEFP